MATSSNATPDRLMLEDAPPRSVDDIVHKLDMSNGSASISLGPLVVNEDGTLARISNWDKMTEGEQKTTMRVLTKRNAARLTKLRELEKEGKLPAQVGQDERTETRQEKTSNQHEEL